MNTEKILIVDDDPNIYSIIVPRLKEKGYNVLTARDGEAGVEYLSESPDIIMTDLFLPKISGLELLRRIRLKNSAVPVVVFSAVHRDDAFFEDLKNRYSISGYFLKPVQVEKLLSTISELTMSSREQNVNREEKKITGELLPLTFPVLLHKLYIKKASGILRLQERNMIREFYFKKGVPVFSKSNMVKETLGRVLLDMGLISKVDYETSIRLMLEKKKKHGEVLLEMGVLPINLKEAIRIQLKQKLLNSFDWMVGSYTFVPTKEMMFEIESEILPGAIIVEGMKSRVSDETCTQYLSDILDQRLVEGKASYSLEELGLNKEEEKFFFQADGEKTANELIERGGLSRELAKKLLISFLILEMLRSVNANQQAPQKKREQEKSPEEEKLLSDLRAYLEEIKGKNYFQVLGVSEKAETDEIKKSYFLLAREYHPDRFYNKSAELRNVIGEIFTLFNNAFNTLGNAESRKKYIERLSQAKSGKVPEDRQNLVNAELQFQKGMVYFKSKDYAKAEECFKWAVKLNPKEAEYSGWLGWVMYKMAPGDDREIRKAEEAIKHALALNEKWDQGYMFLGYLAKARDDRDKVEEYFKKALECNPRNEDAMREVRLINMRKGKDSSRLMDRLFKKGER